LKLGLKDFRAEVDIFRPDEVADAAALVALLNLVPPAVDLVADHAGLVDKEDGFGMRLRRLFSAPATAEKNSQPGKTLTPPAAAASNCEPRCVGILSLFNLDSLFGETGVDGGEQALGDGRFG